jgi:hypothetical protein
VRVSASSMPEFARVRHAMPGPDGAGWTLFLVDDGGAIHEISVPTGDKETVRPSLVWSSIVATRRSPSRVFV